MTTVAYAAVCRSGLSFENQLWMREEIVPELKELTDAIHAEGAKASIQLGHCGNMSHRSICGCMPYGASRGFNLYSPTFVQKMNMEQINEVADAYGEAVKLAIEAGFDAVEIHAGHGYLISQFLSPYTNHRRDEFGGSLENRMRFMKMCVEKAVAAGKGKVALFAKLNTRDGFKGGQETDELIEVAKVLRDLGIESIVLSGGFVSRHPQYVMRGQFPVKPIVHYFPWSKWWLKLGVTLAGKLVERGITNVQLYDVSNTHVSYLISEAFRVSHLVLASVTYNLDIYPVMKSFLHDMKALNVQNRMVALIENGSWATKSGDLMEEFIDNEMKQMTILNQRLSIASSLPSSKEEELDQLADAIADSVRE